MKKATLQWRGRDILVKYKCINYLGTIYAIVIDKNGNERRLHRNIIDGSPIWRGGVTLDWPHDLILLLSDFFETQPTENIYATDVNNKPDPN